MSFYFKTIIVVIAIWMCPQVHGATPMWSSCSSVTTNFQLPSIGGDYESIGCTYSAMVSVDASALAASASASISIARGIVLANSNHGLEVVGLSSVSAKDAGPLVIKVRDLTFLLNAKMAFTGTLPRNSLFEAINNSF
eukprot:PhF_6_TR20128/c0_g1_i1/m.29260